MKQYAWENAINQGILAVGEVNIFLIIVAS